MFGGKCGHFSKAVKSMNQTDGTIHTAGGFARITGSKPVKNLRVGGLILTSLLGLVLLIWMSHTTWERLDRLQREFAALKVDNFYLGVHMQDGVQRLNDILLRYRLYGDQSDHDLFMRQSQDLTSWFQAGKTNASSPLDRDFFEKADVAYTAYLIDSTNMLQAGTAWFQTKAGVFPAIYAQVTAKSQHLLDLCDAFIQGQRQEFDVFVRESNSALLMFQRLMQVSAALLMILAGTLVVLFYRGMIAPLRQRLTVSEAIIARHEKLVSLGVLAAGVAHEIRNPLTAIKFRLFSLKKILPNGGTDNEDAAVIGNEISRLERIVKDFLQFARPSEPELSDIPAERVAQEVTDLLKPQLDKKAILLEMDSVEPAWVRGDMQQLKQVLINLIQNSADSIGREGRITLRIRANNRFVRNGTAEWVTLEVEDTGKGIPPEVQQRLFDPFFTTKEGGSGLGLSIAARIIEKHGGELHYQTQLNLGTTFTVVLPRLSNHERKNIDN